VLPRSLRKLEIAGSRENAGALQPILSALPRLTELTLLGRMPEAALSHPRVTSLAVFGHGYASSPPNVIPTLSPERFPAVRELVLRDWLPVDDPVPVFARSPWARVIERFVLDKPATPMEALPIEWAELLARGLGKRKLRQLEITSVPITLPVRAALTPLCDELISPSHAVVLDETTTHVMHANKPEWGRGKILKRHDGKLEVKFGKQVKVFKADAPFLVPSPE
jgi:hypothetical protein